MLSSYVLWDSKPDFVLSLFLNFLPKTRKIVKTNRLEVRTCLMRCVCVCVFTLIHREGFICLRLEFQGTDQR